MGLDANFPAVRISDPTSTVPVYHGHQVIGYLGPDDAYHSAAVNVTCRIARHNGPWYQLWGPAAESFGAAPAYVSASRTYLINDPATNPMHDCRDNTDQPGPILCLLPLRLIGRLPPRIPSASGAPDGPGLGAGGSVPARGPE